MLGRTYAIGYEPDLQETLLDRPRRTVLNQAWTWAVWYPLRRSGRFSQLPPDEQRVILVRARHDRHVVRRGRLRARRPPGVPRPRQERQRLRRRPDRQRSVSRSRRSSRRCGRRSRRRCISSGSVRSSSAAPSGSRRSRYRSSFASPYPPRMLRSAYAAISDVSRRSTARMNASISIGGPRASRPLDCPPANTAIVGIERMPKRAPRSV